MLGKPSNFIQPISVRSGMNQVQLGGHSLSSLGSNTSQKAPNFHPRPSSIRTKLGNDPKDLPSATVIKASQRHHGHAGSMGAQQMHQSYQH